HQLRIAVAPSRWRGIGAPVSSSVVGDLPVPGARQRLGSVDDVTAGRGDAVEEDDRRTVSDRLTRERARRPPDSERTRFRGGPRLRWRPDAHAPARTAPRRDVPGV